MTALGLLLAATLSTPQIDSIVPNVGYGPVADAVVYGSGFVDPVNVRIQRPGRAIGGAITSFSPTAIGVRFTLSGDHAGAWNVRVVNPDGVADTLLNAYTTFQSSPRIDSVVPASGVGTVANIVVYGADFSSNPQASLQKGSQVVPGLITSHSPTTLGVQFSFPNALTAPGIWDLREVNSDGGTDTLRGAYEVIRSSPRIDSIVPNSGVNPEIDAVIHGSGFLMNSVTARLQRNNETASATVTSFSPTALGVRFVLGTHAPATWDVRVANSDSGAFVLPSAFHNVQDSPPLIDSIVPNIGRRPEANAVIYGSNIHSPPKVWLSGPSGLLVAGFVTASSPTQISVRFFLTFVPARTWDVVAQNAGGGADTLFGAFQTLPPQVFSIEPDVGCGIPATVVVRGDQFQDPTVRLVRSGATLTGQTLAWSESTATVRFNLSGQPVAVWDVALTNSTLDVATLPSAFHTTDGPCLFSVDPSQAADSGSVTLTVSGAALAPGLTTALFRTGESDIPGTDIVVAPDGSGFTASYVVLNRGDGVWSLRAQNPTGSPTVLPDALHIVDIPLAVPDPGPATTRLESIAPNPSRSGTVIRWSLATGGMVHLAVHDLMGRRIAILVDGWMDRGRYATPWSLAESRAELAAGLYFVNFNAGGRREVHRLILVR